MTNTDIFNKILNDVCDKYNLTWYEVFDSEKFNEVATEICKYFNATLPSHIDGYSDWYFELCEEL